MKSLAIEGMHDIQVLAASFLVAAPVLAADQHTLVIQDHKFSARDAGIPAGKK